MSDPSTSKSPPTDGGAKKSHSPVVRIIEWVVIGALGLVVANEAYSKFSYEATLEKFNELHDGAIAKGVHATVEEYDELVSGMARRGERMNPRDPGDRSVDYRWRSFFKPYHIVLSGSVNDDGKLEISMLDTNVAIDEPANADGNAGATAEGGAPQAGQGSDMGGGQSGNAHGGPDRAGGNPPMPPGPMAGGNPDGDAASRPELETDSEEADDSAEESNDE